MWLISIVLFAFSTCEYIVGNKNKHKYHKTFFKGDLPALLQTFFSSQPSG